MFLVYFRSELNKVVSVFDKSNENIPWTKIGNNPLSNNSLTCTKENECNVLELIEKQVANFSESEQIIIGGDFNSGTGTKIDFIVDDRKYLDFLPEAYELDTFTKHRNNEDVSLNSYGEQLI